MWVSRKQPEIEDELPPGVNKYYLLQGLSPAGNPRDYGNEVTIYEISRTPGSYSCNRHGIILTENELPLVGKWSYQLCCEEDYKSFWKVHI